MIGKTGRDISQEEADSYIAGYGASAISPPRFIMLMLNNVLSLSVWFGMDCGLILGSNWV